MYILKSEIPNLFPQLKILDALDENYFDFVFIFKSLLNRRDVSFSDAHAPLSILKYQRCTNEFFRDLNIMDRWNRDLNIMDMLASLLTDWRRNELQKRRELDGKT